MIEETQDWKSWFRENCKSGDTVGNWDGGSDSGCVYCEIEEIPKEVEAAFVDAANDLLGYYSWSGGFHSCGQIKFENDEDGIRLEFEGNEVSYEDFESEKSEEWETAISDEIYSRILRLENDVIVLFEGNQSEEELEETPQSFFIRLKDGVQPEGYAELLENIRQQIGEYIDDFSTDSTDKLEISVALDAEKSPAKIKIFADSATHRSEGRFEVINLVPEESGPEILYVYKGVPNITRELLLRLVKTTSENLDLEKTSDQMLEAMKMLKNFKLDHVVGTSEWYKLKLLEPADTHKYKDLRTKKIIFAAIRPEKFFAFHASQGDLALLDHRTLNIAGSPTEYWLYNCGDVLDGEKDSRRVRANVLKCICPSTGKEHWIMVGPWQQTVQEALTFIFGSPSSEAEIIRQGDILFCRKNENAEKFGGFDPEKQIVAHA